ncbi:hypothetical protein MASR1M107_03920 [Ignavibacteriales bacterium]
MTRKILFTIFTLSTILFLTGCDNKDNPLNPDSGKVFITSTPTLADIYVNGSSSGKKTGDTLSLSAGTYSITLKKTLYKDTTFSVTVLANQTVSKSVALTEASFTVTSTPAGAKVYLNGVNTGTVTPAGIRLALGTNTITLSLGGYKDTTFTVPADSATKSVAITLTALNVVEFASVRIYESFSTASVPSGLILSVGRASTIGSGTGKDSVDIYYKTAGYLISSAKDFALPRETYFKMGTGANLADGEDSPVKNNTWLLSVADTETNYFFMYTQDQNYAKMKIIGFGGGTGVSDPAYIDVRWYFNKTKNNTEF